MGCCMFRRTYMVARSLQYTPLCMWVCFSIFYLPLSSHWIGLWSGSSLQDMSWFMFFVYLNNWVSLSWHHTGLSKRGNSLKMRWSLPCLCVYRSKLLACEVNNLLTHIVCRGKCYGENKAKKSLTFIFTVEDFNLSLSVFHLKLQHSHILAHTSSSLQHLLPFCTVWYKLA